jgi:hypothetical protein
MSTYIRHRQGVQPAASVMASARPARRGFNGTKGLSAMLLAAMVSALVVVADQLIETWADGHLMVAWVALWLVGFTAIALFADAANKLASTAVAALDAQFQTMAQAQADAHLWRTAQSDPRVMADLDIARTRQQG